MKNSIYLASQSPRRRELLDQIGVKDKVVNIGVFEHRQKGEPPESYVTRLSSDKSMTGAALYNDLPTLGADTIVVLNDQVLEKPGSKEEAMNMLLNLSDNTHQVLTAVTLSLEGQSKTLLSSTDVTFRRISEQEASRYWDTGEPADKAGGYGIQGIGSLFVKEIKGSYSGVVGLPLFETQQLLAKFGVPVL